jgi:hypothetical protein
MASIASRKRNGSVNVAELRNGQAVKFSRKPADPNAFFDDFEPMPLELACIEGKAACSEECSFEKRPP